MITARFVDGLCEEWESVSSLDVQKNTVIGSPSAFVTIEKDRVPFFLIKVHTSEETKCFSGVRCIEEFVVIGYGDHVHFLDIIAKQVKSIKLSGYFGHLYTPEDFNLDLQAFDLLVASAETLLSFRRDGTLIWESECLGLDGVNIHEVENSVLLGSGEWDPPGGWQPFKVRLSDGNKVTC